MGNPFVRFVKNKPAVTVSAIVVLLLAAVGIAALLGAFGSKAPGDIASSTDATPVEESTLNLSDTRVQITAEKSDRMGVSPDSEFKLVFDAAQEESALASSLRVEPEQPFRLKQVSRGEFRMQFDQPLAKDSLYRFILSDRNTGEEKSWAFQTKKTLNVARTLPRNKAIQVPVNSGIEVTFTAENLLEPEKWFEISPKVTGRFEQHGKTLVFVPDRLEESTVYTVTVKKGIGVNGSTDVLENDYTFVFQTAVPEKNSNSTDYFGFSDIMYSFTPQAVPTIQIYAGDSMINTEVSVELFQYPDADHFLNELKRSDQTPSWAVSLNSDKTDEEKGLDRAASVKARIVNYQSSYWKNTYLLLPSSLTEGYYLVKAKVGGRSYYTRLQINPASVYLLATKDKTLAWLNDSISGKPMEGAEVLLDGGSSVRSDGEGLATLGETVPASDFFRTAWFLIKPSKGLPFIAQMKSSYYNPYYGYYYSSDITDNYWTYLYLDKGIYLPQDTVNIWGVIKPRNGGSIGKDGVLELVRYDYSSNGEENQSVLTSSKIQLSPNGTFTGSLRLSNYNPGSYTARVKIGDKVYASNYVQIMDYTKPAYRLDITPDRNYLYVWESVNFDIRASFFEGTPVKGLKLDYNCSLAGNTLVSSDTNGNGLVSDAAGESKLKVTPVSSEEGWRPQSLFLNVSNKEAEERAINEYSSVAVFPKDTMIEVEGKVEGTNGKISIATSRIDLGRLKGKDGSWFSEDEYRGAAVDMPLTARLYEKHYEKKKTGDYYDYINKVKRDTYEYYEVQNLLKEYSFTTSNGKYEIGYTAEKDRNYYVEVTGKDSGGRTVKENQYLYNWNYYNPYSGNSAYSIMGGNSSQLYGLGETVSVSVRKNDNGAGGTADQADTANGKYLFIRMKNGILDTRVSGDPEYKFPFDGEYIPNMYVKALCFDGTNIYDAGLQQFSYDSSESRLDVKVKADKEQYKPGDTVKLSFDVKDAKGSPCSSEINVSVVDEAFFAVSPQYVDTLASLYGPNVSSGIVSDYLSYHAVDEVGAPMAEGGEGGDMYVRKDFKDSALFLSVTSGSNGKAEASFRLPDNLTSWRVTYQSVTEDLKAGSGKMNIASRLPFFIDTIFNKVFLTGDSPSLLIRSSGTELPDDAEVSYNVVLKDDKGGTKGYSLKGKASSLAEVSLDPLAAGNYTVRVEAASGNLKDAMERSFQVSDSLLETSKTEYTELADGTVLSNAAKGLTSIVFYGEDSSLLYNELRDLYWTWGQRLDQKLASKVAGDMLEKNFQEKGYRDEEFDISRYQTEDGGLAILTYDSSSPSVSAKMCSLAAEYIDRKALSSYFRKLLDDGKTMPEDIAYAYWGLAALHEPVLLDIRSRLEAKDVPPEIRLIYGAALAEIGDYQGARQIYEDAMRESGKTTDTYAYIERGTRDGSVEATALCSLIGLRINAPEKLKLFRYIKSNSTSELLVNLERLMFVRNYIKTASLECGFHYELNGTGKQIELKNGANYRLTVTPEQLKAIRFSAVKGKVIAATTWIAPVSEAMSTEGSPVSIKRTYTAEGGQGSTSDFERSDTIRIKLTPVFDENAPDGFYEITDVLPAGIRYVAGYPGKDRTDWYPDEVTGQKVVFGYYYNKTNYRKGSIEYFARAVSPGSYTADSAAIRHMDSGITGFTSEMKVRVK